MGKIENFISDLRQKPFIISLINDMNADILAVGGVVRDLILNKPNKDIDLIVRKIPIDILISHLQKFGRVDVVGKSFGVLKFIDSDGVDYDLALPRKEKPSGEGGYRGFEVQSDENLPIEDDLIRRDARFNAMAININTGKFIDPLGGLEDIEKKQISAANPDAFSDDPLRMLRMTAFASRFNFTIEPETMQMIIDNASRVKEIAPERILTEFDKILKKGVKLIGVELLIKTGLFEQIFGVTMKPSTLGRRDFDGVRTMGEFIFLMTYGIMQQPAEFFKNNLKGDLDSYKEIKALETAFDNADINNVVTARTIAHNMYVIIPQSLQSQILPTVIETAAQELLQGKYPKTVSELAVNGNDLMQVGLKGKEIGDAQKMMLMKVYGDKVKNDKEELLILISSKSTSLDENLNQNINVLYSAIVLDEVSKQKLIKVFSKMIPEGWEVIAHHVTLNLGAIDPKYAQDLGKEIEMSVIDYALDDKVMAVGVEGYPTNNKKAHITIAVNRTNGGKPFMSNQLSDWKPIGFQIKLTGIVTEVKK